MPDLLHINGFAFEGERGVSGDHERASDARQVGGQALCNAIDEMALFRVAADVRNGKHHDGKSRRQRRGRGLAVTAPDRTQVIGSQAVGPDRARYVFQGWLTQIGKLSCDLASHLIIGGSRDAYTAGFCDPFKPCSDVDSVSEDIIRLDDYVADIDT